MRYRRTHTLSDTNSKRRQLALGLDGKLGHPASLSVWAVQHRLYYGPPSFVVWTVQHRKLLVYYVTFVFSITVLRVLKYKICVTVYCDVVNVQPRFNFFDQILNKVIMNRLYSRTGPVSPKKRASKRQFYLSVHLIRWSWLWRIS